MEEYKLDVISDKIILWCDYTIEKNLGSLNYLIQSLNRDFKLDIKENNVCNYFLDKDINYYSIKSFIYENIEKGNN